MKTWIVAAAIAAAMTAGTAAAQDRMPRDPLAKADGNGDGVLTRDEMLADVDKRFAKVDANKDGKITADEREQMGKGLRGRMMKRMAERRGGGDMMERRMERIDTDKDGAISIAEQRAQALRRFDMVDANKDGRIDAAEREAIRERMMELREMGPPPPPPPGGAPGSPRGE